MEPHPATPSGTQEARFLLDTNICIYIRRKKPEEVLRRFRTLKPGEAALSVITFGELVYGIERSAQWVKRGRKSGSLTAFGMTSGERGRSFFKARLPRDAQRAAALELLRELAQVLPVLELPETAAEAYGTIRAELERKGQMIGNNDLWIAAHAKAAGLTLVTNNEREFRRVHGLKVQNWAV
jgi:tRNA(fMet)-specific endonuclease VapC